MKALPQAFFDNKVSWILLNLWIRGVWGVKTDEEVAKCREKMVGDAIHRTRRWFAGASLFICALLLPAALVIATTDSPPPRHLILSVYSLAPLIFIILLLILSLLIISRSRKAVSKGRRVEDFIAACEKLQAEIGSTGNSISLWTEEQLREATRGWLLKQAKVLVGIRTTTMIAAEEARAMRIDEARREYKRRNALAATFSLASKNWDQTIFDGAEKQIAEIDAAISEAPPEPLPPYSGI